MSRFTLPRDIYYGPGALGHALLYHAIFTTGRAPLMN